MIKASDAVRAQRTNTRGLILEAIRTRGPISRGELAEATGLTAATMTNVVRRLLEDGLVLETGRGESTGGKRRVLLEVDAGARFGVGIQLGFGSTVLVVSNMWGAVVGRSRMAGIGRAHPDEYIERLAIGLLDLIDSLGLDRDLVVGAGVAVPGSFDGFRQSPDTQELLEAWASFPLQDRLVEYTAVDAVAECEAIAAAIGERWSGAVADSEAFAVILMEDAIGVGAALQGRALRGAHGHAGDLGHMLIDPAGPSCTCGARGCLVAVAGPAASLRRYSSAVGRQVSTARLNAAAVAGDPVAVSALAPSVNAFATAAASMTDMLDLERIVLAGTGFGSAMSLFITGIQTALDERSRRRGRPPVIVQASVSVRDAPALGAAALVLHEEMIGAGMPPGIVAAR